jgi:hypothetical protein
MSTTKRAPLSFKSTALPIIAPPDATSIQPNKETSIQANNPTDKQLNTAAKRSRDGTQFIAAHVNRESVKQLKLLALQEDKDVQTMLREAINDLFAKYKLTRIAELPPTA